MLEAGTILQKRYLIISKIGQGGMGTVYQAKDERLGVKVALKETVVSGEALEKAFEREAKLLAKLRHPVLPVVSDYFFENASQYLVMQYIEGKDLGQLLAERGAFSLVEVLTWAGRLLDALDYLHTQQPPIIHRDIKPNNLKLTDRGEIILLDFGLAKGSATVLPNTTNNSSSSVYGYTPHYAPIEQIEGTGTDARSDVYALAATLYHLLTGVKPPDAMPRVLSLINGQGDPLRPAHKINPKVPTPISDALTVALSQKRDERPADAAAMRSILEEAIKISNDPSLLNLLNPTVRLSNGQTSEQSPLNTTKLESSSELPTLVKTEKVIGADFEGEIKRSGVGTNAQIKAQETQLATQANSTVTREIPEEKTSKLPFVLAIASVFVIAFGLIVGLFFWNPKPINIKVVAVDAFNASKNKNQPTLLSAKEILSKGLDEPRYFEFMADAGEIKFILNNVSNGAAVSIEVFDKDYKALRYKDNSTNLYVNSVSYTNEQVEGAILNPTKQKIILKLSNTYPDNIRAYRLRLIGSINLLPASRKENANALAALESEFKDRDEPTPLATNEILRSGSEKQLYYVFGADAGEIKLTLDVISNGANVEVKVFDSNSKPLLYEDGTASFSLSSTYYKHEKNSVTVRNPAKQNLLLRISNVYPENLKAYRLNLKGPIKISKDTKKDTVFASLLEEFKDRDTPNILVNNELINRGNKKDLYYTFRLQPGTLTLALDLIGNGGSLSVEFFDDKDKLIRFEDNNTSVSIASANHHEKRTITLTNDRNQSVLMRVSQVYPENIKVYRIRLEGELQIIKPDPNINKPFESLAKLFNDRDNPKPLEINEIVGSGSEKDLYYLFFANEGELKIAVDITAAGGTLNIELFDEEHRPIFFKDKKQIFSLTSTENKLLQQHILAQINEAKNIIIRVSTTYPESIKDYKIHLSGNVDLPTKDALNVE